MTDIFTSEEQVLTRHRERLALIEHTRENLAQAAEQHRLDWVCYYDRRALKRNVSRPHPRRTAVDGGGSVHTDDADLDVGLAVFTGHGAGATLPADGRSPNGGTPTPERPNDPRCGQW